MIFRKKRAEFFHYALFIQVFIIFRSFPSQTVRKNTPNLKISMDRATPVAHVKTSRTPSFLSIGIRYFSKESRIHVSSLYNINTYTIMNKLNESHFSFKCPMNWDDMSPSSNGRFCSKCSKEVYDLTNCTLDEIRELQSRKGSICGMIRIMSTATVAAASLSLAACKKEDSNKGNVVGEIPASVPENLILLGDVCPIPTPPPQPETNIRGKISPIPPTPEIQEKEE